MVYDVCRLCCISEGKPRKFEQGIGRAVNNIEERRRISRSKTEILAYNFGGKN